MPATGTSCATYPIRGHSSYYFTELDCTSCAFNHQKPLARLTKLPSTLRDNANGLRSALIQHSSCASPRFIFCTTIIINIIIISPSCRFPRLLMPQQSASKRVRLVSAAAVPTCHLSDQIFHQRILSGAVER